MQLYETCFVKVQSISGPYLLVFSTYIFFACCDYFCQSVVGKSGFLKFYLIVLLRPFDPDYPPASSLLTVAIVYGWIIQCHFSFALQPPNTNNYCIV